MSFSERAGYKERSANPLESMNMDLKNSIFNEIYKIFIGFIISGCGGYYDTSYKLDDKKKLELLWTEFFKKKLSEFPDSYVFLKKFEVLYDNLRWYEVYDLVEFIISIYGAYKNTKEYLNKIKIFNRVLEKNNSSYRVINNLIQPISNKETIEIIDSTFSNCQNKLTKEHLKKAQDLYSSKQYPDYRQSCLESMHALEAYMHFIFNNKKPYSQVTERFAVKKLCRMDTLPYTGRIS